MKYRSSIEVGRFLWGTVRKYFEKAAFLHPYLYWREGSGWMSRDFMFACDTQETMAKVSADLKRFAEEVNAAKDSP